MTTYNDGIRKKLKGGKKKKKTNLGFKKAAKKSRKRR